jgi:DNA modification methylase
MEIITKKLADLKPAGYNPRHISPPAYAGLKASIERFGLVEPVVWNRRTGNIVGGHQRLKVLQEQDVKETIVVVVDLPETEEKALNVTLNNPNIAGEFTSDLQVVLEDIRLEIPEMFVDLKLDELYLQEPIQGRTDPDEIPQDVEPRVEPGEIWELGRHRVMCGDATKAKDVEQLMDGRVADMVFTDPPYNVDYGANKHHPSWHIRSIEGDKQTDEEWFHFNRAFIGNILKHSKGDIYVWGASGPEGMKQRLWLVEMGYHWSATIIWKKQQLVLSPAKYQRMYEPCFYGWKGKSSYNGDRRQTEVWEIDRPLNSDMHPTMKPVELCAKGIGNSSRLGDIVLDQFLGSGSTLIACEQLERICYGMEIEPRYCDVIIQRWEDFTGENAKRIREGSKNALGCEGHIVKSGPECDKRLSKNTCKR